MAQQQIVEIEVDTLQANPLQPRGLITPESLSELIESIKEHGVLEPLVIAKTPAGFQIIAGERRWRAAKIAGLKTVPAVVKETTPQGMLEMALVENVQREDLNPLERAQAFIRLIEEFGLNARAISIRISKSAAYVSNTMRLLKLPDALKDGLLTGLITEGHARALAGIHDHQLMVQAYKIILKESASVRRAEDLARRMRKHSGQQVKSSKPPHVVSEEIDRMVATLSQALGGEGQVKVKLSRSRAETSLLIKLKGGLDKTEDSLQRVYQGILKDG